MKNLKISVSILAGLVFIGMFFGNEDTQTPIKTAQVRETEKHRQCRLELHRENPFGSQYNGLDVLVWDTKDFGTYEDGSVWVGYNRKVGDRVYRNLSKICG